METLSSGDDLDLTPDDVRAVIVRMCRKRLSIAEISSYAAMPIGVARVLVGDLVDERPPPRTCHADRPSTVSDRRRLIERTLDGFRAL